MVFKRCQQHPLQTREGATRCVCEQKRLRGPFYKMSRVTQDWWVFFYCCIFIKICNNTTVVFAVNMTVIYLMFVSIFKDNYCSALLLFAQQNFVNWLNFSGQRRPAEEEKFFVIISSSHKSFSSLDFDFVFVWKTVTELFPCLNFHSMAWHVPTNTMSPVCPTLLHISFFVLNIHSHPCMNTGRTLWR